VNAVISHINGAYQKNSATMVSFLKMAIFWFQQSKAVVQSWRQLVAGCYSLTNKGI
jgi:hypothetical protein